MAGFERTDVEFPSGDARCAAWLYRPLKLERPPLVVLGHGFGATREMRLDAYAERFAEAGLACLVFTYRHFGDSGGEPRQLLDVGRQLSDWAAALAYARALPNIDARRIAIWGTSFGGGHVIEMAARDGRVAAVVSQCPFTNGLASLRALGPKSNAKVLPLAIRDLVAARRRAEPVLVPLIGPPGSAAMMTALVAAPGYRALIPADLDFRNGAAARIAFQVGRYRPGRSARNVACPILFCICERDSITPAKTTRRYARHAPRAEIKTYPIGHFDIYLGEAFEQAVSDQTEFLVRHLSCDAASESQAFRSAGSSRQWREP
jgi:dienelactone hydrolase